MHHPTDRIAHTTAFVTPVVEHWLEREIARWDQDTWSQNCYQLPPDTNHHHFTMASLTLTLLSMLGHAWYTPTSTSTAAAHSP